jgi:hypothetical protein
VVAGTVSSAQRLLRTVLLHLLILLLLRDGIRFQYVVVPRNIPKCIIE